MITRERKSRPVLGNTTVKKQGERHAAAGKSGTSTIARQKPLETVLGEVFRAHWRTVNAKIVRGVDVARERAHMFFATNDRECLRVARRYYAPTRAAKLTTASDDEILRLSEPWFSAAREELEFWDYDKELRKLVAAEYIALVWNSCDPEDLRRKPAGLVAPLPDESVGYGDVYEITAAGYSVGSVLRVCKSVAVPFLKSERREAAVGIEQEFYENARSDDYPDAEHQWQVAFLDVTDGRAIDIDITENFDYVPCFGEPQSDLAGAAARCRKEAEQGSVEAQIMLADYYTNPSSDVPEDRAQAAIWYRKAAELGHPGAQLMLGVYYYKGIGVKKDYAQAAFWSLKAAEQGEATGQHNIAYLYSIGRGIRKSYAKAASWYHKAAEQDYHRVYDAQLQLGILYKTGRGVQKDLAQAAVWFRKAAKHGDYDALVNLGELYAGRRGLRRNFAKAVACFRKAASHGKPLAQMKLGESYARGQGVRKSLADAYFWLSIAARRLKGKERATARKKAINVGAKMAPTDLAKARERVKTDYSVGGLGIPRAHTTCDIYG